MLAFPGRLLTVLSTGDVRTGQGLVPAFTELTVQQGRRTNTTRSPAEQDTYRARGRDSLSVQRGRGSFSIPHRLRSSQGLPASPHGSLYFFPRNFQTSSSLHAFDCGLIIWVFKDTASFIRRTFVRLMIWQADDGWSKSGGGPWGQRDARGGYRTDPGGLMKTRSDFALPGGSQHSDLSPIASAPQTFIELLSGARRCVRHDGYGDN